jgi:hypothetical protein
MPLHELEGEYGVAVVNVRILFGWTRTPDVNVLLRRGLGQNVEELSVRSESFGKDRDVVPGKIFP